MNLAQIRELLQSLCLVLHAILIFRITSKMVKYEELFGLDERYWKLVDYLDKVN